MPPAAPTERLRRNKSAGNVAGFLGWKRHLSNGLAKYW